MPPPPPLAFGSGTATIVGLVVLCFVSGSGVWMYGKGKKNRMADEANGSLGCRAVLLTCLRPQSRSALRAQALREKDAASRLAAIAKGNMARKSLAKTIGWTGAKTVLATTKLTRMNHVRRLSTAYGDPDLL